MMKFAIVKWYDAESTDSWTHEKDIEFKLPTVISIGFLIKEDDKMLCLSPNYDTNNKNHSCFIFIPKGCIRSIKVIGSLK